MLDKLTKKQEALCDIVVAEYDAMLDRVPRSNTTVFKTWLKCVYGFYELPTPRIEVVPSPYAAFKLATELTGTPQKALDNCGISEAGWVSFYDYFNRIKVAKDAEIADTVKLRDFMHHYWDTLLLDECAIVVKYPKVLKRDADGNLHCATGPCIVWGDGHDDWAWHGVWVPERVITNPRSYTPDEYLSLETEVRRAVGEIAGWDHVVKMLGAKSINAWTDPNTKLTYELFATSTECWIRKQSPVLQTAKQPYYFEPVHEDLKTAQAARKWQACDWTPAQCEADPELVYAIET
jgi:hypothetical protein